ncbi:MAG: mechanosensitive ion channel family protein [Anaerolineae bacterium]|nr:mechanosensitive ion channel family protein [Anaerolineae bacterium]
MIDPELILNWLKISGFTILLTIVLAVVGIVLLRYLTKHLHLKVQSLDDEDGSMLDKRTETISRVLWTTGAVLIVVTALLIILDELGVPIMPIVASVGFVGLAFGLGAQTLVKDMISGMFVLIENQYTIGDAVVLGGITGTVESITLRKTTVRDLYGTIYHIPNGEVRTVANKSRDWSRALVEVGITYDADVDKAIETLAQIGADLQTDSEFAPVILETPLVTGVEGLDESAVRLRIMVKTKPGAEANVQRYLRRQIRLVFEQQGIEIAFPTRQIQLVSSSEK